MTNLSKLKRIRNNLTPKIISLAFAVIFWFYVMDQVNPEMIKEFTGVPVTLKGIEDVRSEGLYILNNPEYTVDVTVSGRRNDVLKVTKDMLKISADLRGYGAGINTVPLSKSISSSNVSIYDLSSNEIKIAFDNYVSVQKKITVNSTGNLADGRILSEIIPTNEFLIVEGPESVVGRVSHLLGIVDIGSKDKSYSTTIQVIPVDASGKQVSGVTVPKSEVGVDVSIDNLTKFSIKPKVTGELSDGLGLDSISTQLTEIELRSRDIVPTFSEIETENIDLSKITESGTYEYALVIPEGFVSINKTSKVKVDIEVNPLITKEFSYQTSDMASLNLASDLEASVISEYTDVKMVVTGTEKQLADVSKSKFELIYNLSGLTEGTYKVPIEVIGAGELSFTLDQREIQVQLVKKGQ